MRIAMGVEYDGSAYNGWQKQNIGLGIQTVVEKALSKVANHQINSICAGRTDTGVHARSQVIHFDTITERDNYGWLAGVNSNLPPDINITWVKNVNDDFHARFSASKRKYSYKILNQKTRSSLSRNFFWWVYDELDVNQMQSGAKYLIGKHDFTSFRATSCQASSPIREIFDIQIQKNDEGLRITLTANAYLQRMVRNIVGALVQIGKQEKDAKWMHDVLKGRDRKLAGIAAPAHGLTLLAVKYPNEFDIDFI
ncbi:tRNA pseudouridine(38-40) synthase TruA [Woeseiaceae bacterium]|nr:tRNA pseudouridine(38-40) synthase TruA [Woeseiaceae bacterium]